MHLSSNHSFLRLHKLGSVVLAAVLGSGACALAGPAVAADGKDKNKNIIEQTPVEPKFWFDLSAGGEFDIHSTKFLNDSGANFGTAAAPLPGKIQTRDFSSTHDTATINGRAEVGYKVLPCLSVFTGFTYSHADGQDTRRVGRVGDPTGAFGPAGGVYNLYGDFGKYQAFSGIAGVKVELPRTILDFIHAPKCITPYFSASGGAKYLDSQHADFFAKDGRIVNTGRETLFDSGFVGTAETALGYNIKVANNFDVTLESGYGYDTKPQHDGIADIAHANRDGDRLYSNVYLGGKIKF